MTIIRLVHDCGIIYDLQCETNVWLLYYERSQKRLKKMTFCQTPSNWWLSRDYYLTSLFTEGDKWCGCVGCKVCRQHSHLLNGWWWKSDVAVWAAKFAGNTATCWMGDGGKVMWLCELQSLQVTQPPGKLVTMEKWGGCVDCKLCNWYSHIKKRSDVAVWAAKLATGTATVIIRDKLMDHQKNWYGSPQYKTCNWYSPSTFLTMAKKMPMQCYAIDTYPPNFMILYQYTPKLCLLSPIPHVSLAKTTPVSKNHEIGRIYEWIS